MGGRDYLLTGIDVYIHIYIYGELYTRTCRATKAFGAAVAL